MRGVGFVVSFGWNIRYQIRNGVKNAKQVQKTHRGGVMGPRVDRRPRAGFETKEDVSLPGRISQVR